MFAKVADMIVGTIDGVTTVMTDNRDYEYSRRSTLASAVTEGLQAALEDCRVNRNTKLYNLPSAGSAQEYLSDHSSDSS